MDIPTRPANAADREAAEPTLNRVLLCAQDAAVAFGPIDRLRDVVARLMPLLRRRHPTRIDGAAGHWASPRPSPLPH
jgi:hypothetical protein